MWRVARCSLFEHTLRNLRILSLGAALHVEALGIVALSVETVHLGVSETLVLFTGESVWVTTVDVVPFGVVAVGEGVQLG